MTNVTNNMRVAQEEIFDLLP
ncbi:MAG: hypothetical protein ACLRXQ_08530 [Phascolarctobacterium faecium]